MRMEMSRARPPEVSWIARRGPYPQFDKVSPRAIETHGRDARAITSNLAQRLIQIGDEVFDVFQAEG